MKRLLILILFILTPSFVFAKTADSKNFPINADNMFMISISVISKLDYKIEEIQSSSGYILFKAPDNVRYLLMVSDLGNGGSNVKITKAENSPAPLREIQEGVFSALVNETANTPKKAE